MGFLLALQFLTRYPARLREGFVPSAGDLGRSTRYFPLVGLLAGLDLLFLRWLLELLGVLARWPLAGAALLLAYWVWACGSLHLDGLADTADGLASGRRGEDLLEVMHDSRSGAFGMQALALDLLLKFAWLASLPARLWWALPLPLVFSRLLASLLCQRRPYAGRPGSLSAAFIESSAPGDAQAALALAFAAFLGLSGLAAGLGLASPWEGLKALGACLLALLAGWTLLQGPERRLGGISGDLIGFGVEACELAACYLLLFTLAA